MRKPKFLSKPPRLAIFRILPQLPINVNTSRVKKPIVVSNGSCRLSLARGRVSSGDNRLPGSTPVRRDRLGPK